MNAYKITLSLIIFSLVVICGLQSTSIGCSRDKNNTGDDPDGLAAETSTPFFSQSGDNGVVPINWAPVSENVMIQITDMFAGENISINSIDRSNTASSAVRCILDPWENNSRTRDLLNSFYILYNTFPDQNSYYAEVDEEIVITDWDILTELVEAGFSFDCPEESLMEYWRIISGESEQDGDYTERPVLVVTNDGTSKS